MFGTLCQQACFEPVDVVGAHHIPLRRRNPDVAVHVENGVCIELLPVRMILQRTSRILQGDQGRDIKSRPIHERTAGVACGDQNCPFLRKKPRCMLADGAESSHDEA